MNARNQAASASEQAAQSPGDPNSMQGLAGAESALTGALGRMFALMESYPDLKANQNMAQLMEELTTTENKIAFSRQAYNDSVMVYNTQCSVFPSVIIANSMGFHQAELFEIDDPAEKETPKVSFS